MQDSWLLRSDSNSWRKTLKNSHNSQIQRNVVNTLCQETNIHLNQKVGFEGIPKLLSYWKLQPVAHKVHTEWKSESSLLTKTNSHSLVRIFHGLNKLVTNLNNKDQDGNEQETSEVQLEEYALKLNASDFASRSKAEAKPQRRDSASSSTRTVLIGERTWTDVEPRTHSNIAYPVSQNDWSIFFVMVVYLEKMTERLNCRESKTIFRNITCIVIIGLTSSGRASWQEEDTRKIKYCTDSSGAILYLRALQGHSGRSLMDLSLPDNVIIPDGFFKYIYHVQSIYIPSSIRDWYLEDKFWAWILCTKKQRSWHDRLGSTASCTVHAESIEGTSGHGGDIKIALKKGLKFFQTRSNAIILFDTVPAYCIPKVVRMELENYLRSLHPKIS